MQPRTDRDWQPTGVANAAAAAAATGTDAESDVMMPPLQTKAWGHAGPCVEPVSLKALTPAGSKLT